MSFELINADCLGPDGMPSLLARSVDVVISDPPYSEHVHSKSRRSATKTAGRAWKSGDVKVIADLGFAPITTDEMEAAADQFARLARRWVLVFCDLESAHLWRGACVSTGGLEYIRTCAWEKLGGTPQFTGDRPAVWGEAILVFHPKGRKRWNGGGKAGLYSFATALDRDHSGLDERMHTTQKPVALMEALVRDFTDPGETILDAFAGSGTTLLAATRLGRHSIGYEKDPVEHAKALRRLQGEKQLPDGFIEDTQGSLAL